MSKLMCLNFASYRVLIGICMAVLFLIITGSNVDADEVPAFFLKIAKNMPRVGRSDDKFNEYFLKTSNYPTKVSRRDIYSLTKKEEGSDVNRDHYNEIHKRMINYKSPESSETTAWGNFPLAIEGPPELWRTLASYTNDKYGSLSDDIDNEIWRRDKRMDMNTNQAFFIFFFLIYSELFQMITAKHTITWISMFVLISVGLSSDIIKPLVKEFSLGKFYYRIFYMDNSDDVLYVGAMDYIFKLDLFNINDSRSEIDKLQLMTDRIPYWLSQDPDNVNYHNHIKVIQSFGKDRLFICGSHARDPRNWIIYKNLTLISTNDEGWISTEIDSKCSKYLDQSEASIMVTKNYNNDEQQLYTTISDSGDSYTPSIYRTKFNQPDLNWTEIHSSSSNFLLGESANFVGSFEIEDQILFFFSEYGMVDNNHTEILAVESQIETVDSPSKPKEIFSRVARICKEDNGFGEPRIWSTFSKATLQCKSSHINFNKIESIYKIPNDDNYFYGTFTVLQNNSVVTSAICSFSIDDIKRAFDGPFKKVMNYDDTSDLSETIPEPNANLCSRNLTDKKYSKAPYFLMDYIVPSRQNKVVFNITNVILTKVVVDKLMSNVTGVDAEYTVYYAGSDKGRVYKLVQWTNTKGKIRSDKLDEFDVTPNEKIHAMEISSKYSSFYVASDNCIKQISLILCNRYNDSSRQCKRDPYCKLDNENKKNCQSQVISNKSRRSQIPQSYSTNKNSKMKETTTKKSNMSAVGNTNSTKNIKINDTLEITTTRSATEIFIAKYNKQNITTENPSRLKSINLDNTLMPPLYEDHIDETTKILDQDIPTTTIVSQISTTTDIPSLSSTTNEQQSSTIISDENMLVVTEVLPLLNTRDILQNSTTLSDKYISLEVDIPLAISTTDILQYLTTESDETILITTDLPPTTSSDKNISMTTDMQQVFNTKDMLENSTLTTIYRNILTTNITPVLDTIQTLQNSTIITTTTSSTTALDENILITTDILPGSNTNSTISLDKNISMTADIQAVLNTTDMPPSSTTIWDKNTFFTKEIQQNLTITTTTTIDESISATNITPMLNATQMIQHSPISSDKNITMTTKIPLVLTTSVMIQNSTTSSTDSSLLHSYTATISSLEKNIPITTDVSQTSTVQDILHNTTLDVQLINFKNSNCDFKKNFETLIYMTLTGFIVMAFCLFLYLASYVISSLIL